MHDSSESKLTEDRTEKQTAAVSPTSRNWQDLLDLTPIIAGIRDSSAFELMEERPEIRMSHRLILLRCRDRLGPPDAASEAALGAICDLDRLERMAEAVLTVTNWQDLVATP